MNRETLIATIKSNLQAAGLAADDVRVQPDPFQGWRVAVIEEGFQDKSQEERKEICLRGLDESWQWLDLLTPEEKEWAGPLPSAGEEEYLPLWPEMLAKGEQPLDGISFPGDDDGELSPPLVVTFYSLRGGVGRSTALVGTAKALAARGHKVICVDMDLEAPGLLSLFRLPAEKIRKCADGQTERGVVPLLVTFDSGGQAEVEHHLVQIKGYRDLYLLPAGYPDARYARLLRHILPDEWYRQERNPMLQLLAQLSSGLSFVPDVILLDARTGLSEISGPLLFGLSDMAVLVFYPHPQAKQGTGLLTRGLLRARVKREKRSGKHAPIPRFLVSPLPNYPLAQQDYQKKSLQWIGEWMQDFRHASGLDGETGRAELMTCFVNYQENIATSDYVADERRQLDNYESLVTWVEDWLPSKQLGAVEEYLRRHKDEMLQQLPDDWEEFFLENSEVNDPSFGIETFFSDEEEYFWFRVLLRATSRNELFANLIKAQVYLSQPGSVEEWPQETIKVGLKLLVGEERTGGLVVRMHQWMFDQLANANGRILVNCLLQLFSLAIIREREKQANEPHFKSIIRPQSLYEAWPDVAKDSLNIIREYFPHLGECLDQLHQNGKTPVERSALSLSDNDITHALHAGLLKTIAEDDEGEPSLFSIPEIYRYPLGLQRVDIR